MVKNMIMGEKFSSFSSYLYVDTTIPHQHVNNKFSPKKSHTYKITVLILYRF